MSDLTFVTASTALAEANRQSHAAGLGWSDTRDADNAAVPDGRAVTVLVVDDDLVDRMVIRRSFKTLNITNPVVEVDNALSALDMLRGRNGCEKVQSPCIVLLDLHMPRMGGIEFLAELSADPALRSTLIFVLTTSPTDEKWAAAHAGYVAGLAQKCARAEHPDGNQHGDAFGVCRRIAELTLPAIRELQNIRIGG